MRLATSLAAGIVVFLSTAARSAEPPAKVRAAMDELWRRGHCLLSAVHKPAGKQAPVPKDIGSTPVIAPRLYDRRGAILCHATDGKSLWAADDQQLVQVDGASGKVLRQFDRSAGLPDDTIQDIACAGGRVWLAMRSQLASVDVATGKIATVPRVKLTLGRLAVGESGVWLVGDGGAYHLPPGQQAWRKLPALPDASRLQKLARRGFWSAWWRQRARAAIPSIAANADGLYVVVFNRLLRFAPGSDRWTEIARDAWTVQLQGRTAWALTTDGVVRYDAGTGKTTRTRAGHAPAAGRPVGLVVTGEAVVLISQPDYDEKAGRFVGGGISRLDLAGGEWRITETVDGRDIRFVSAVCADGSDVWVGCTLYDRVVQLGAHPGMAHVKRWRPHACGIGVLHGEGGGWTLTRHDDPKTEQRWVMGQQGTVEMDHIGPESITDLLVGDGRLWGVYQMIPERFYAGYYISAGCLARRTADGWGGSLDVRTGELHLAGEQPELLLISRSHGESVVLAEGQPVVLGLERVGGRTWVVAESGLFVHDAAADRFVPALREGYRTYWRATHAAAGDEHVWFAGDGGTVSRYDRATGRIELVGVATGRKITHLSADGAKVTVRTAPATTVFPVDLAGALALPAGVVLSYAGGAWSAAESARPAQADRAGLSCRANSSYLFRGDRRVAFLKGVYKPEVLCADGRGKRLWLATYSGLASIPLPEEARP